MVHNIVKVAEKGGCSLDFASTLVLLEFIYVYLLGAVMMVMAGASCVVVTFITTLMICIVMLLWSHVFTYPKCLKCCPFARPVAPVDAEEAIGMELGQSVTKTKVEAIRKPELASFIKNSLNACFILYLMFSVTFMAVVIIAAEWSEALLGISIISPIHILGLYLTIYLRDGLIAVHTKGLGENAVLLVA